MKTSSITATTFTLAALITSAAGCEPPERDGLYVWCEGAQAGLYYENLLHGRQDRFSLCLGREHWAGTGETGGIDLDRWTNDTEDIDSLRSMCVAKCTNKSSTNAGNCLQSPGVEWQIKNYKDKVVPDPLMEITDPAHLHCIASKARLALAPGETKVIPPTNSPTWPSSGQPLALACDDFQTCADEFTAPVGVGLYYDDTATPWGPGMGGADHLATISVAGHSALTITLRNPQSTPSSDAGPLEHGEVEYSAPDCGDLECPLYLANLTISNASSAWELYSDDLLDNVSISDVTVQLRRPTLGVWNTSTGELYFGEELIELVVTGTLQIGEGPPMTETYFVTNDAAIFGQLGPNGEVEIDDLRVDDSEFSLAATLDYDSYAGTPTTVGHGLDGG